MAATGKITLDIKDYEAKLKLIDKLTAQVAANSKKNFNSAGNADKGLNKLQGGFSKAGSLASALGSQIGGAFGAAGQAIGALAAGPIAVVIAAVGTLIALLSKLRQSFINVFKESGEMAAGNAASIREAAEAEEKRRETADKYLQELNSLSNVEKMSNEQKEKALQLVRDLAKSYGDLGIRIDETTGKITGVDKAMIQKAEKDKKRRLQEVNAEIKELQNSNKNQQEIIKNPLSSTAEVEAASKKIQENVKRIIELQKKRREVEKSDDAGELRKKYKAQRDDEEQNLKNEKKNFEIRKKDDEFNSADDLNSKIKNRKERLEDLQKNKINPLEQKIESAKERANKATGDDKVEAERQLIQLQRELQKEKEHEYEIDKQIHELAYKRIKAQDDVNYEMARQEKQQQLLILGKNEEAARQKFINDMKKQGIELDKKEVDRYMMYKKDLGTANLQSSQMKTMESLYDKALRAMGKSKEADIAAALKAARDTKGADLTKDEEDRTKKLLDLQNQLSEATASTKIEGGKILTNSLTARGGFAGGAVMPGKENINKQIDSKVEKIKEIMDQIKSLQNEIKTTVEKGLKV